MTRGSAGLPTWIARAQPHGQPKSGSVNVPYTSSVTNENGRPGNGTAECPGFGLSQVGWFPTGVSRLSLRLSTSPGVRLPSATSLVSRIRKKPDRYAKWVTFPSGVGVIEWRPMLLRGAGNRGLHVPWATRVGAPPEGTLLMSAISRLALFTLADDVGVEIHSSARSGSSGS